MNVSAVHLPRPVSTSGVRLAVKLTPHGPANAVLVAAPLQVHGPDSFGGGGMTKSAGWPESARDMSGSGPLGPSFHGVWQSLQPMARTRYALSSTGAALAVVWSCASGGVETARPSPPARKMSAAALRIVRVVVSCIRYLLVTDGDYGEPTRHEP